MELQLPLTFTLTYEVIGTQEVILASLQDAQEDPSSLSLWGKTAARR